MNKNEELKKSLCERLFSFELEEKNKNGYALGKLIITFNNQNLHVPNDELAKKIYDYDDVNFLKIIPQMIYEYLDGISFEQYESDSVIKDKTKKEFEEFKESLIRNVRLSVSQKINIINASSEALKNANEAKKTSNEAKKTSKKAKLKLKEATKIKDNIYTDFISILGIFTAITFATFGGLQLLGNVFGKADISTKGNVGGVIILGGIYIFGTYLLLIVLLTGIKKISRLNDEHTKYNISWSLFFAVLAFSVVLIYIGLRLLNIK